MTKLQVLTLAAVVTTFAMASGVGAAEFVAYGGHTRRSSAPAIAKAAAPVSPGPAFEGGDE